MTIHVRTFNDKVVYMIDGERPIFRNDLFLSKSTITIGSATTTKRWLYYGGKRLAVRL